jgi:hypothetical protein
MRDLKRRFARIHNLMTRQPHDVRFRDEMLNEQSNFDRRNNSPDDLACRHCGQYRHDEPFWSIPSQD